MVGDKGPGPSTLQKRISTKMESSEGSEEFIRGRKSTEYMWVDTWADSERERVPESHPGGSLNYFYGAFLLGVLWPIILVCLVHSPYLGFPGGSESKASVYNAGDLGSIPGLGRFPGEGNGNSLQYSCLENPMDGGAWCRLLSVGLQRVEHN